MKNVNIQPLGKNILIQPEKIAKKTQAGILLPDSASEERPQQGIVVAVGESEKITVQVGQSIIYTRYAGAEVKIDERDYLIIKIDDVLAVIE